MLEGCFEKEVRSGEAKSTRWLSASETGVRTSRQGRWPGGVCSDQDTPSAPRSSWVQEDSRENKLSERDGSRSQADKPMRAYTAAVLGVGVRTPAGQPLAPRTRGVWAPLRMHRTRNSGAVFMPCAGRSACAGPTDSTWPHGDDKPPQGVSGRGSSRGGRSPLKSRHEAVGSHARWPRLCAKDGAVYATGDAKQVCNTQQMSPDVLFRRGG